LHKKEIYFD
jgi:actin